MTMITEKSEARVALREMLETLDLAQLQLLAVHGFKVASPQSAWTFGMVMEVLAARFDRRSFINICESITNEIHAA